MSFKIKNFDSLMSSIEHLSQPQQEEAIFKGMESITRAAQRVARELTPVDSGELRRSIKPEVKADATGVTGYLNANSEHAAYLEFGTGPIGAFSDGNGSDVMVTYSLGPWKHVSRKGKVFYTDYWVYYDKVRKKFYATRGQMPQPFMYPASQVSKHDMSVILIKSFRKFINKVAKGGS